jgi:tetratricopeptide (TPR) repeat protein
MPVPLSIFLLKRIDGVAGIYEKSTSKEATTAAALMELGKIYRQLGQTQKAFQAYQKCLEITKERVYLETEPDLEPIRNRDDFKQILGEIRPG